MTFREYLGRSRAPRYSLVFALPLLLLYEGLSAALTGSAVAGVRNGADVLLKTLFVGLGGRDGLYLFGALLVGGGAWLVWRDRRTAREPYAPRVFAWMALESAAYAAVFGVAGGLAHGARPRRPARPGDRRRRGAGPADAAGHLPRRGAVRGAGVPGPARRRAAAALHAAAAGGAEPRRRCSRWSSPPSSSPPSTTSGPLGDTFTVPSFTFRAIAGVAFSVLYVTRGFGIAAWTHALYDLGLSILQAGS